MNSNFKKNTILLLVGTILNKGLLFLIIPFFSRWLLVDEYGLFDVYSSYISLLAPVLTLSIGDAVFRFGIQETDNQKKKTYITSALLVVVGAIIIIVSFSFVFLGNWIYLFPFLLYAISEIFANYLLGYLRSIKRINIYSFVSIISTAFIFCSVLILVRLCGFGLSGMIYGYFIGASLSNLVIVISTKFYSNVSLKLIKVKEVLRMLRYSIFVVLDNISWWIVNVSDKFLINVFLNDKANGIYAASSKIPNLLTALTVAFNISWQEGAIDAVDGDKREDFFNSSFNKLFVLVVSAAIVCVAFDFLTFKYFFSGQYAEAILYSPILISSSAIHCLIIYFTGINIAMRRPRKNMFCVASGAVINFIINILLIKQIGLFAAAISTLIANLVILLLIAFTVKDVFKPRLSFKSLLLCLVLTFYVGLDYKHLPFLVNTIFLIVSVLLFFGANIRLLNDMFNKFLKRGLK